jgi:hypothetical protein
MEELEIFSAEITTVTVHVAENSPSSVVAVMIAVPVLTAVTVPLSTKAMAGSDVLHETFWEASSGRTVAVIMAVRRSVSSRINVSSEELRVMLVESANDFSGCVVLLSESLLQLIRKKNRANRSR